MTDDPRLVTLSALNSGARVLVILSDGERLDGHVEQLLHGGFNIVARHEGGRVRRCVWYADVDSMSEFVEPGEDDVVDDDLQALSRRLREQAHVERQTSLAERLIRNSQRES